MVNALVDVCLLLGLKTFNDGLLLIKLSPIYQALKFELSEPLLDLPKWQLYGVVLKPQVIELVMEFEVSKIN